MKKTYAELMDCFSSLKKLNGKDDSPYEFKDNGCYAIAKSINFIRRHLRDYNAKVDELVVEYKQMIADAGKSEEAITKLKKELDEKLKSLRDESVEVTFHVIPIASLCLDKNKIQPGTVADLIDAGLVSEP